MGPFRLFAIGVLVVLFAASCGGEAVDPRDPDEEWHSLRDAQAGISVRYPPGWDATSSALTEVVWPPNRLAVASFPLDQAGVDPDCSATTVLGSLPSDGAFVFLFEYTEGPVDDTSWARGLPSRPAHFTLDGGEFANYECFGPSHKIQFVEQGRVFQAHVSFGEDAPNETKARALDVLDSLEVAAGP